MARTTRWQALEAIGPPLALILVVVGGVALAMEIFVERPEVLRFAREGRLVSGQVYRSPPAEVANGGKRPRNRSGIRVDDPELGPQTIEVYGVLSVGQRVPLLCLTAAGHCSTADDVKSRLDLWPFTPLMLTGIVALVSAALFGLVGLFQRVRRAARG